MATSQNGYRANDRSLIASYEIPGGKVALRKGDVATVLTYFAKRFHSEVEPLKWPGNWGYAERTIRGNSTTLSNHASGTAIDLNAPKHPLGKVGTFSSAQRGRIRKILNDCGGVLRWGGDYRGRKDEMHVEINAGTAAVARVAKAIRAGKKPGPAGGATSSGGGGGSTYESASANHEVGSRVMRKYTGGSDVYWLQRRLYKLGYDIDTRFDKLFGPNVEKAVKAFQKDAKISVDGEVYTETIKALRAAKVKRELPSKPKTPDAPKFPFPKGHWMGVESSNPKNHSGYYAKDRAGIKVWQSRMKARGWTITVDGRFGSQSERVAKQFQKQVKVAQDGLVGEVTFAKSWTAPIT